MKYNKAPITLTMVCMVFTCTVNAQSTKVRPGKGMDLIPGDFAEYTNTEYSEGITRKLPSSIMVAMGGTGELEGVIVLVSDGEKLITSQRVFYDLSIERARQGEVIDQGEEIISIMGKDYNCKWEKRKNDTATAIFWTSASLPFEQYAKIVMESGSGKKRVTELIYFGPETKETKRSQDFQLRLKRLMSQAN